MLADLRPAARSLVATREQKNNAVLRTRASGIVDEPIAAHVDLRPSTAEAVTQNTLQKAPSRLLTAPSVSSRQGELGSLRLAGTPLRWLRDPPARPGKEGRQSSPSQPQRNEWRWRHDLAFINALPPPLPKRPSTSASAIRANTSKVVILPRRSPQHQRGNQTPPPLAYERRVLQTAVQKPKLMRCIIPSSCRSDDGDSSVLSAEAAQALIAEWMRIDEFDAGFVSVQVVIKWCREVLDRPWVAQRLDMMLRGGTSIIDLFTYHSLVYPDVDERAAQQTLTLLVKSGASSSIERRRRWMSHMDAGILAMLKDIYLRYQNSVLGVSYSQFFRHFERLLSRKTLDALFAEADVDGDSHLCFEEFSRCLWPTFCPGTEFPV